MAHGAGFFVPLAGGGDAPRLPQMAECVRYGTREPAQSGWRVVEDAIRAHALRTTAPRWETVEVSPASEHTITTAADTTTATVTVQPTPGVGVPRPPSLWEFSTTYGLYVPAVWSAFLALCGLAGLLAGVATGSALIGAIGALTLTGAAVGVAGTIVWRHQPLRFLARHTNPAQTIAATIGPVPLAVATYPVFSTTNTFAAVLGPVAYTTTTALWVWNLLSVAHACRSLDKRLWRSWRTRWGHDQASRATGQPAAPTPPTAETLPVFRIFGRRKTTGSPFNPDTEITQVHQLAHAGMGALRRRFSYLGERVIRTAVGAAAEHQVGLYLERALPAGYSIAHDVAVYRDNHQRRITANIDHLIAGPCGVVMVDTKRWSGRLSYTKGRLTCADGKCSPGGKKARAKAPDTLRYEAGAVGGGVRLIIIAVTDGTVTKGTLTIPGHPPIMAMDYHEVADYITGLPPTDTPVTLREVDHQSPRLSF